MGGANCPETPRQKMIGMMYLVLTAMLALNVSKDILDAFVVVDDAMVTTTGNFSNKIDITYAQFEKLATDQKDKYGESYGKAMELQKATNEICNEIDNMKYEVFSLVDGVSMEEAKEILEGPDGLKGMQSKDNFDKPTNYFCSPETEGGKMAGKKLKQLIDDYRAKVLLLVDEKQREAVDKSLGLRTDAEYKDANGDKETWEGHNFYHVVAAADITLLNKFKSEVKNVEYDILSRLMDVDADAFKFDNVQAKIIPQSRMLFAGSPFEADVIVAAYDSRQTPEVGYRMGSGTLTADSWNSLNKVTDGENGIVHLKIGTGGIGDQSISGLIRLRKPDGEYDYYPFEDKFTVTRPMASISPAKMNVLYANIENPLIISAPVAPEKMSVTSTGGNVVPKGSGTYEIKPAAGMIGKEIEIKVSNKDGGGVLGTMKFRVKKVPDPVAVVGDKTGGRMRKEELAAASVVRAKKQDGFEFDLNWTINSYKVTITKNGKEEPPIPVTGFRFPETLKAKINAATAGTLFEFTEIKASSPAGPINLKDIVIKIR